jgi:hypothetical protein
MDIFSSAVDDPGGPEAVRYADPGGTRMEGLARADPDS